MKFDWRPERVAYIDFETQSRHDLRRSTAQKYAKDESTRVLTCVVKVDDEYIRLGPYLDDAAKATLRRIASERVLVAHNAPFDAAVWEYAEGLGEATWFDTLPCARAAGLPGPLDQLGTVLTGRGKDKNGERLIEMLCILKGDAPAIGPAHGLLMQYNHRDVELLEQVYSAVKDYGVPKVMQVDRAINMRGIPVDRSFAEQLKALFAENFDTQSEEFEEIAPGIKPGSWKAVSAWMQKQGFDLKRVNKQTLKAFADEPERYFLGEGEYAEKLEMASQMLATRREIVGIGKSKIQAALDALEEDDRIRDQFVIYGAGPGRWAGRQLQPHNMPSVLARSVDLRSIPMDYASVRAAAEQASKATGRSVSASEILNGMLRHMVRADCLCVADYAQIEARVLAWIAQEPTMLRLFADPHNSLYLDLGEKIFGRRLSKKDEPNEYGLCKALVLGCGYGMSGAKFGSTYKARGEMGIVKAMEDSGFTAHDAVKFYRKAYPLVPILWKEMDTTVKEAVNGVNLEFAKCKFYMKGRNLHIELPSGRPLVFRNARIDMLVPMYCKLYGMPEVPVPTVVYENMRNNIAFLYGSKTVENICQGICADLLSETLVRHEQLGLDPVFHVHDEAGCETSEARLQEFCVSMSDPAPWAEGCPILAEGYAGPLWTKNSAGYKTCDALNGKVLK